MYIRSRGGNQEAMSYCLFVGPKQATLVIKRTLDDAEARWLWFNPQIVFVTLYEGS
jgi:hypothetical protein